MVPHAVNCSFGPSPSLALRWGVGWVRDGSHRHVPGVTGGGGGGPGTTWAPAGIEGGCRIMGSNPLAHASQAQPASLRTRDLILGAGQGYGAREGPAHGATVRPCLSCLAPQGAFRLVRSGQVARCMHHPDTPLAPLANQQGPLSHPGHLDTSQSPRRQASPSPARPRPTNTRSVPSSFRLPSSLTSTTTCHLQSLPNHSEPYLPCLALSPSHIHQTHHTYQQTTRYLQPSPTPFQKPSQVTIQHHNLKKEFANSPAPQYTLSGSDCTVHKRTIG